MKRAISHSASRRVLRAYYFSLSMMLAIALCVLPFLHSTVAGSAERNAADQGHRGIKRVAPRPRTKGAPGLNLPNLAAVRNLRPAEPQAPAPISSNRPCYDCGESRDMSDFAAARTEPRNRTGRAG